MAVSGTAQIFLDIKNRLEAVSPYFPYPSTFVPTKTGKFVYMWNDSIKRMKAGRWAGLTPPLIFIELIRMKPQQFGNGIIVHAITVRVHTIDKFFNSTDGLVNFDQDLRIFEFKDWVYQMLQMFVPTNCGVMTLSDEKPPEQHTDVVEYTQDFDFLFTNSLVDQPINSIPMNDTTTLDPTISLVKSTNP